MPVLKYRHECELVDQMLITITVMQYEVLCLFWGRPYLSWDE